MNPLLRPPSNRSGGYLHERANARRPCLGSGGNGSETPLGTPADALEIISSKMVSGGEGAKSREEEELELDDLREPHLRAVKTNLQAEKLELKRALDKGMLCRVADVVPRYCHFPIGRPDNWYHQLASEELLVQRKNGVEQRRWRLKKRMLNEALAMPGQHVEALP